MHIGKNIYYGFLGIAFLAIHTITHANNVAANIEKPKQIVNKPSPKNKINVVIIDAGHGGKDIGAKGLQSTEKQITLMVAKKLQAKLSDNYPDIKFVMTRNTDTYDNVRTKAQKANNAKGDLFICIHVNSSGSKPGGWYKTAANGERVYVKNEAHGTETYVWAADRTASKESFIKSQRYISKAETEGIDMAKGSQEEKIAASLKAKRYFKNSVKLANYIEAEYAKVGRFSRGVKQRNDEGIWVLQATGMPSILTEVGFNSNIEEEAYMVSNDGQNQIVDCIANAFANYKDDVENTNNPNPTAVRKKKLLYIANSSLYLTKL